MELSARETQVMKALLSGQTRLQAADELGISPHTLNFHIERIYRFLEYVNIADSACIHTSDQRSITNCV